MKILFILNESVMHERIGVMYLSAQLKADGHEVRFVLAGTLGRDGLNKVFRDYSPHLVGYSAMTGEHLNLVSLNRELKNTFEFISVFGGPHATFFPDLIEEQGIDAVCVGEGDLVFKKFCSRVEQHGEFWVTDNFIVKHDGNIFRNPLSPLIEELDALQFPDRDGIYEADPGLLTEGRKTFFSSRGCPYQCSYCFNRKYNELYSGRGNVIRSRSPENFVSEMYAVKEKYPLNIVDIGDDTFIQKPKKWYKTFCESYRKKIGLPFVCNVRANLVTEEVVSILKDAGLDSAWMGVECGNEKIANDVLGRKINNAQIMEAVRILKKYRVKILTQNIVGMPVDNSYAIDKETLDLNINIRPAFAWSSILYPYPGTEISAYARENLFFDDSTPSLETNKRSTVFKYSRQEKRKIENLHKLFGIIVRFPFLRRLTDLMCSLPFEGLYTGLYYLWYGYNYKKKIYPYMSFKNEVGRYFRLWLGALRKT